MRAVAATLTLLSVCAFACFAGPQKFKTVESAKVLAARSIVETVYGVKIRFTEEVDNIIDGSFKGSAETKTGERRIKGIKYEVVYDDAKDIAKATATLRLGDIADIVDPEAFNIAKNPNKMIQRVAFASSRPENARKLAALRAAEVDAYKNLYKEICGFTLESNTKVENFVMKSDKVKASVLGALMGAELLEYRWEGKDEDAVVKLRVNVKELNEMLPEPIKGVSEEYVEAEGYASQADLSKSAASKGSAGVSQEKAKGMIVEGDVDLNP